MFEQLEQEIFLLIQSIFDFLGWAGVAGLMVIEGASGLMPAEVMLALAGWMLLASHDQPASSILLGGLVAAVGVTVGASTTYWFARWGGDRMGRRITGWLRINPNHISRADSLFQRWGGAFAFFGRMIPGVRTFIAIPAGVARMSFPKFAFYTFLGAYLWCTAVIGFGFFMGQEWFLIRDTSGLIAPWLGAGLVAAVSIFVIWKILRRRKFA